MLGGEWLRRHRQGDERAEVAVCLISLNYLSTILVKEDSDFIGKVRRSRYLLLEQA